MKNIPPKIFLVPTDESQITDETDFNELDHEFVFWSETRTDEADIEYVRPPDLHALLKEILADEFEIKSKLSTAVMSRHIKAVFANHGITIDNEK